MLPANRVNYWSVDEAVDSSVGINIDPSLSLSPEEVIQQFKQSTGGSSADEYIDAYANDQQFTIMFLGSILVGIVHTKTGGILGEDNVMMRILRVALRILD